MDSINTTTTNPNDSAVAEATPTASLQTSPAPLAIKQQIASARATKTMLEDFINALDRVTLNGDYAVKFGIGYQFLGNVLKQTTADIKRMQDEANG